MKLDLNFASRRYVNRKAVTKGYWLAAIVLICLLIWFVSHCLLTQQQIAQSESQLITLAQDEKEILGIKSVSLDSQQIADLRSEFARNQQLLNQDSFRWTALFDRIEELLPKGVSIRGFKPNYEKRTLALEGVAKDLGRLQTLLDRLLESDSISNAYLSRHAEKKVKDKKGNEYLALSFSIDLEGVF